MRKLSFSERLFASEIYPLSVMVKEKRKNRHLNNTLYQRSEVVRARYTGMCSSSLVILIKAGYTYEEAKTLLGRL